MQTTLNRLRAMFPELRFTAGEQFCWSPETQEVFYKKTPRHEADENHATWSLLHETGHALLDHRGYRADIELLRLEGDAWQRARELATELEIVIDEQHIEDCLDSYRDWLYKRSICPTCGNKSLQQGDFAHYRCFNCHTTWRVTASRFTRAYRSTKNITAASTVFHIHIDQ